MKNKIKNIEGNIYGMGIYCFKTSDGKVLYVGSGMMNDRFSNHLYHLKRDLYKTNKAEIQKYYDMEELIFEVLHFAEANKCYIKMSIKEKENLQIALSTLEMFYIDMFKDTICNKATTVNKKSSNRDEFSTIKRIKANSGSNNPMSCYSSLMISNILWMKQNGYKAKQIEKYYVYISANYIGSLGVTKWINAEPIKPMFIDDFIASYRPNELGENIRWTKEDIDNL